MKTLTQLFTLPLRYFLRDTNMIVLWQENQKPTSNADLPRQPCAFGTHRVFQHLHHQRLPFKKLSFDGLNRRRHGRSDQRTGHRRGCIALSAVDRRDQIRDMQKGCTVKPDVDECRLHAWQHANHFAEVNIAD